MGNALTSLTAVVTSGRAAELFFLRTNAFTFSCAQLAVPYEKCKIEDSSKASSSDYRGTTHGDLTPRNKNPREVIRILSHIVKKNCSVAMRAA